MAKRVSVMTEESTDTSEVTRTMESLIDGALKIIRNVSDKADHVFVNKNQCKWLARRFEKIGEALKAVKNDETSSLEESAMKEILLVLKGGERLVKSYKDNALETTVVRVENREAFDEVHEQIDKLKEYLFWLDPEKATEDDAADKDRNSMIQDLGNVKLQDEKPNVDELRNLLSVISEKLCQDAVPDDHLSYLHIKFDAKFKLEGDIKNLPNELNKRDEHLRGKAVVRKGQWNGCECAIKEFKSSEKDWNMEELKKEVASLVKLRHPHITQLIGCAQDKDKTYVLYEKMDGDLRELMKARIKKAGRSATKPARPFSPSEELSIIRQIAQGMFYLHQHGIVHGELKCTNLLVKQVGDDIDVKVSDFHCSRELGSNENYKPTHRPRWLPPEAFDLGLEHPPAHDVLEKGDVYSFAMTCCEVLTGGYPFDGIKDDEVVKAMIQRGERLPKLPDHLSDDLKSLIENCWSGEPGKRPSFELICYHLQMIVAVPTSSLTTRLWDCFGFNGSNARTAPVDDVEVGDEVWPPFQDGESSSRSSSVSESEPGVEYSEGLPHYLKIEPENLKRFKNGKLGLGASAEVWAATWHGCKFAVKYMKSNHVSKLRHEVDVMMKLLHPHVVRLVGFAAEGNRCAIVMELMDKSLEDFIKEEKMKNSAKTGPFSEAEAIVIITQLARGMDFMHSRGVAHGDLKCANVLVRHVQTKKGNNLDVHVKLVDFGLVYLESVVVEDPKRVGMCQAPEVRYFKTTQQSFDPKAADVYSFGMMCWEIITGKFIINHSTFPPKQKPSKLRKDLWDLLERCRSSAPTDRPTFAQICDELAAMPPK